MQVGTVLKNWDILHPKHKYSIESGGFTAWPTEWAKSLDHPTPHQELIETHLSFIAGAVAKFPY